MDETCQKGDRRNPVSTQPDPLSIPHELLMTGVVEMTFRWFFLQVGGPLQSPVPGSNLPYSFPFGFQQQPPPGGASGPGSGGGPGLWGNHGPHMSSFPLRPELQQYEPYSPVRGFPVADQMSFSSDSYLMDSAESWGLKQSHIHDKPKVLYFRLRYNIKLWKTPLNNFRT